MTTKRRTSHVIQINHLTVAPHHQAELIARMIEQLDEHIATQPGFISADLQRSRDGGHIINYVLFETAEQLDAAHRRPEFQAQMDRYRHLILQAGPVLYDIVASRDAGCTGTLARPALA